jgi:hypothetical protein
MQVALLKSRIAKKPVVKTAKLRNGSSLKLNFQTPAAVPEPSVIIGLLGVAGVLATQRKFKKASI